MSVGMKFYFLINSPDEKFGTKFRVNGLVPNFSSGELG